MTAVIEGCAVADGRRGRARSTPTGTSSSTGPGSSRWVPAPPPDVVADADEVVDGRGCLATPGLVNTHHHLYQWATRGLAQQDDLFGWLTTLYPVWEGLDEDVVGAAAAAGLGWLARTGCTSTTDHHYVFPRDGGDVLGATVEAAREVGLRFHPTRGSMDLGPFPGRAAAGQRRGDDRGRPGRHAARPRRPPRPVARLDAADGRRALLAVLGHRGPDARGRRAGPRPRCPAAHPPGRDARRGHLLPVAPTTARRSSTPNGWAGSATTSGSPTASTSTTRAIERLAASGTAVAHCPTSNARLGAGLAPVAALREPDVAVGLGVDGSASNEESSLVTELHAAVMVARLRGGPAAMTARDALALGTIGGARVLGREDEIGSLEAGQARRHRAVAPRRARPRRLRGPGRGAGARLPAPAGQAAGRRRDGRRGRRTADRRRARPRPPCGRGHPHPARAERTMTSAPTGARSRTRDGVGESAAAARRRAQGAR